MINKKSLEIIREALVAARDVQASIVNTMEIIFAQPGQLMLESEAADMAILRQRIEICTNGIEVIDAEMEDTFAYSLNLDKNEIKFLLEMVKLASQRKDFLTFHDYLDSEQYDKHVKVLTRKLIQLEIAGESNVR